jgi:putative transposase
VKYAWIAKHRAVWPVKVTCEMLDVSTSGYFEHRRRRKTSQPSWPSGGRLSDKALLVRMRAIHTEVKGEYD